MIPPTTVTAIHVASKHGSPAGFDSAHDLEPASIEPTSQALSVIGAGMAEDVRHAGAWPGHAVSAAKHGEVRKWMLEGLEHLAGGTGVAARGVGLPMSERVLNDIDTATAFVHVRGTRMTEAVKAVAVVNADPVTSRVEGVAQDVGLDGFVRRFAVE